MAHNVLLHVGDVSAEDPMHSPVHGADVESLPQQAAVVLCLHALWRRHLGPVEARRGYQTPGSVGGSVWESDG